MINPEDQIYIDERTSCTKDEAIAKLLGWMQGDIRHQYILMTSDGVPGDALAHMHSFEGSIWDFLTEQRKDAQMACIDAFEANATETDLNEKEQNIVRVQETIIKAKSYQRDIDDELAKGGQSTLKVDESQSLAVGATHISLNSLEEWAIKKYGISVLDFSKSTFLEQGTGHDYVDRPANGGLNPTSALVAQMPQPTADDDAVDQFENREESDGLSRTVADNLYITLALLIEGYAAQKGNRYHKTNRGLNVTQIAEDVMGLIETASEGKSFPGQSPRTVRGHIDEALRVKNQVQSLRYGNRSST